MRPHLLVSLLLFALFFTGCGGGTSSTPHVAPLPTPILPIGVAELELHAQLKQYLQRVNSTGGLTVGQQNAMFRNAVESYNHKIITSRANGTNPLQ